MRKLKLGPNIVVLFQHTGEWRFTKAYARAADARDASCVTSSCGGGQWTIRRWSQSSCAGMFLSSESIKRMSAPGDLFVSPTVPAEIRLLDWRRSREIAAIAYLQMKDVLAARDGAPAEACGP